MKSVQIKMGKRLKQEVAERNIDGFGATVQPLGSTSVDLITKTFSMCQTHKDFICRETTMVGKIKKQQNRTVTSGHEGLGFNPSPGSSHSPGTRAQMPTVQVKLVFFGQCQRGLVD